MNDLNRRHLLAVPPPPALRPPFDIFGASARAAVPPAGAQAPGFYRYKVGSLRMHLDQ